MGVPAVVLEGDAHVSREGSAAMRLMDLHDCVARTAQEYVVIATRLGCDLPRLNELRQSLRERMKRSPLMDAASLTRRVEGAYRQMWRERNHRHF
jgi:predicted O-linked N-acetylglucosamine transferase (SPINDLY family)